MNVGERMRKRRKELKISAEAVAEKIGVSRSNVYRYEKGEIEKMPTEVLIPLSEILKTTPAYLMGWDEHEDISTIYNQLNQSRKGKVYSFAKYQLKEQRKIYNLGATAAGPALAYTDDFVEEEKLERIPDKADFVLTIKGRSMEPRFLNGEKVFVQSANLVENGEVAIVEIEGDGVTCKKVKYDYENQKVILQSLNEDYEDMIYDSGKVKIVGRVIE